MDSSLVSPSPVWESWTRLLQRVLEFTSILGIDPFTLHGRVLTDRRDRIRILDRRGNYEILSKCNFVSPSILPYRLKMGVLVVITNVGTNKTTVYI